MATCLRDYANLRATDPHEYPYVSLIGPLEQLTKRKQRNKHSMTLMQ